MLKQNYQALVIGSTGAIGQAFVDYFRADPRCAGVQELARTTQPGLDLLDPKSIHAAAQAVARQGPFQIIVDATGALTIDGQGPEKSIKALTAEHFTRALQVNTIGPALLLKHFVPLLAAEQRSIYAKLSARVGSISDNRLGGWYSYRASKAAMNMVLQSAALEWHRRQPGWRFVALQPGTVRSRLSEPFSAGVPLLLEPEVSVVGLMRALEKLQAQAGAHFIDHQGQTIGW